MQHLQTVEGHTLNLSVSADREAVHVTLTDTLADGISGYQSPENIMLWFDGELVLSWWDHMGTPPWRGHQMTRTHVGQLVTYTARIDRTICPVADGEHTLTAGLFTSENLDAGYIQDDFLAPSPQSVVPDLLTLVPGKILRVAFHAGSDVLSDPAKLAAYRAAGFNTMIVGVFRNPRGNTAVSSLDIWREWSLNHLRGQLDFARASGLYAWGIGDDICRDAAALEWLENTPWAEQAVRETFALKQQYPEWVATSMVDEMPGTPDDRPIYREIVRWCREESGPHMSWPHQRVGLEEPWEDPSVCTFLDRYTSMGNLTWRHGLPYRVTAWQIVANTVRNLDPRPDLPCVFIHSATGPYYFKKVEGDNYTPGDDLRGLGTTPEQAIQHAWLIMAYGCCGLRTYALDTYWAYQRASDPPGSPSEQQTGFRLDGTDPLTEAVSVALNAIERYEALLTGSYLPPMNAPPWVIGQRTGLKFWVNCRDRAVPCPGGVGGEVLLPTGAVPYTGQDVPGGCVVIREVPS